MQWVLFYLAVAVLVVLATLCAMAVVFLLLERQNHYVLTFPNGYCREFAGRSVGAGLPGHRLYRGERAAPVERRGDLRPDRPGDGGHHRDDGAGQGAAELAVSARNQPRAQPGQTLRHDDVWLNL